MVKHRPSSFSNHPKTVKDNFTKGSLVEVKTNEEGFQGAWFQGTIIENPKFDKCMVEYTDLVESDENPKPLIECVNMSCIRPRPPPSNGDGVGVNDVVDVFYDDAWWTGLVIQVVNDLVLVYFDNPPDEKEVERSNVRLHFEWRADGKWKNGKWKKPRKGKDNKGATMLLSRRQRWLEEQQSMQYCDPTGKNDNISVHVEEIVEKECIPLKADHISVNEMNNALSMIKYENPEKIDQMEQSSDQDIQMSYVTWDCSKEAFKLWLHNDHGIKLHLQQFVGDRY